MSSKSFNNATTLNTPQIAAKLSAATLSQFELIPNLECFYNVKQFGAKGDGTTDDATAVAAAVAAAISTGTPLYFPAGNYKIATAGMTTWDLTAAAQKGIKIFGAGIGRTIVNFPNVTSGVALYIISNTDFYDFAISDMAFTSSFAGVLLCVGNNSFTGPLNTACFINVGVFNSFNNSNTVALRLNYVVNSNFIGCRANCFADGSGNNAGTSLECRQASFNTFTNGSYGNGYYGVRFKDGSSFGNVFIGCDLENINYCVKTDSSTSGNNTFIGGQWSLWETAAVATTGSLSTNAVTIINPNIADDDADPFIDQTNYSKIRLIDGSGVSTPAFPATGVAVSNLTGKKILVTYWGGSVSVASISGFNIGLPYGSVIVPHGSTIALTYTGSPAWSWSALE